MTKVFCNTHYKRKISRIAFCFLLCIAGVCSANAAAKKDFERIDTLPSRSHQLDALNYPAPAGALNKPAKKNRVIKIDDWPMIDILFLLERWYNVKFRFIDCLQNERYYITGVSKDRPLQFWLGLLQELNAFNYVVKGDEVELYHHQESWCQ